VVKNIKNKSKAKKWLIVGSILVAVSMLLFVAQYMFTEWFHNKLETSVYEQSDGVYKLKLYGFESSPFVGNVSVDSLTLTPDYKKWEKLKGQNKEVSRTLLDLKSSAIALNNLSFFKMVFKSKVDLGSLVVQQPKLLITAMQKDTTTQHKPMHETVKGLIKDMRIGTIEVKNANFRYREAVKSKKDVLSIEDFNLTVDDYQLDSASFYNPSRAYYSSNITFNASNAVYYIPNDYYKFTTDSLSINIKDKTFSARHIRFDPTVGPTALSKAQGRATTYIKIKIPSVTIENLNYPEHSRNNNLIASSILIQKPTLNAFKDKKHFNEGGQQPLPHEIAQSIKSTFSIDKVQIKNGYCRYEELAPKGTKRGHIYFSGFNTTITNLTNDPKRISRKNPAIVKANALLMGKTKIRATLRMPLLDKNGYHTLSGSVSAGSPQALNPILVPTNFIKVDKGYVQGITFNATLNKYAAKGTMRALYSNLEVELLSAGSGGKQSFGKKILSKAADWFIVENSNPDDKGESPRIGKISVKRKRSRSAITYWKDCIASGLMSSMGLEKMAEQKFN
jgi:hypothetical protein